MKDKSMTVGEVLLALGIGAIMAVLLYATIYTIPDTSQRATWKFAADKGER